MAHRISWSRRALDDLERIYSYRIIYRLQVDEIVIAAVIHGKRILQ